MFAWLRKRKLTTRTDQLVEELRRNRTSLEMKILQEAVARRQRYVVHYFGSLKGFGVAQESEQDNLIGMFRSDLDHLVNGSDTLPDYLFGTWAVTMLLVLLREGRQLEADQLADALARIVKEDGFYS
jgi:hypothetical protein